ncbi:MAG: hypothetical protein ACOZBW_13455 [Thermodesulfobacteriota bacterium]
MPFTDNRNPGRFHEGVVVSSGRTGETSAIALPWRKTRIVSPCSTALNNTDACCLNSVKVTVFIAHLFLYINVHYCGQPDKKNLNATQIKIDIGIGIEIETRPWQKAGGPLLAILATNGNLLPGEKALLRKI